MDLRAAYSPLSFLDVTFSLISNSVVCLPRALTMMREQSPGSSQNENGDKTSEQWPWWLKWAQKAFCVFSGLSILQPHKLLSITGLLFVGGALANVCGILGVVCCVMSILNGRCIVAGIIQIMVGFTVMLLEAPCCCAYLEFIDSISKFSDGRPHWQKASLYCIMPIVPMAICQGATTIVGNALVLLCGFTFVYLALGKKASREDMLTAARSSQSGLVDNAQPMSQTDPPLPIKPSQIV